MHILTIVQGIYGQRITANIQQGRDPSWVVECWQAPRVLPTVIDYPEDFLPDTLPAADLIISLGEHPGVAELLPDLARLCGAQAAIVPVDNTAWLPAGLMNQVAHWLAGIGVAAVFPKPFCSLTTTTYNLHHKTTAYDVPLVAEFARRFGRPHLALVCDGVSATVAEAEVVRDSPCGCVQYVAQGLAGVDVEDADQVSGMRHHHYPCLAGMTIDADYSDTLMHISGHLVRDEVARQTKPYRRPPVYLRPSGRSS